ncbi:PAS domain-containing protein [Streptomyces sp. CA-179760]|uniref:PAS domain-containing protein n=1 Tax=Streptomyces sp. CA-179760 TaxID=3240054 RepID=UPI003D92064C
MGAAEPFRDDPGTADVAPSGPGGLLDVLNVAAVLLDAEGRIDLWSPQAEILFGYTAEEALGQYAAHLLIDKKHLDTVLTLLAQVMRDGESWAGVFPVRHKDGSTRLVEFRNMRLQDDRHDYWALGLATDQATLRSVERNLSLSARLVSQSPIGLGMLDTDLRYISVNPAEERMNGVPAAEHIGHHIHEVLPFLDESFEAAMREVLATGTPSWTSTSSGAQRPTRTTIMPGRSRSTDSKPPTGKCWEWPPPVSTSPTATVPWRNSVAPPSPSSAACSPIPRRGGPASTSPTATAPPRPPSRSAATGSTSSPWPATRQPSSSAT